MGSNRYKVPYDCECGESYGYCGKKNYYLFEVSRSTDIGHIVHVKHADDPDPIIEFIDTLSGNQIIALRDALSEKDEFEGWEEQDHETFKKVYNW